VPIKLKINKHMSKLAEFRKIAVIIIIVLAGFYLSSLYLQNKMLQKIIERLTADTRIAEVLVTDVKFDARENKTYTTIKFLEFNSDNKPLEPKYFTFSGNVIQFQSMVIRFDDLYVKRGHPLKGKSAYFFMKAFCLQGKDTEVFDITKVNEVPQGYRVSRAKNIFEQRLWQKFWGYAFDPKMAKSVGVKNAQIEAPGTRFLPGVLYTIKIEHDGGMRIDSQPLPEILKGEKIK